MKSSRQIQGVYVTNPKHELYKTNCCFYVHYHTNAGFMIKYCNQWYTVPLKDCHPIYYIGVIGTQK